MIPTLTIVNTLASIEMAKTFALIEDGTRSSLCIFVTLICSNPNMTAVYRIFRVIVSAHFSIATIAICAK